MEIILKTKQKPVEHEITPFDHDDFTNYFIKKDGKVFLIDSEIPYTGKIKIIFPNGKTYGLWNYSDGLKEGTQTVYNKNGTKDTIFNFKNDKQEGKKYNFSENGKLESVYTYKNGVKDGPSIFYYEDGKVQEEGYTIDGGPRQMEKKIGRWIYYKRNGKIRKVKEWGFGRYNDNRCTQMWVTDEKGKLEEVDPDEYDETQDYLEK